MSDKEIIMKKGNASSCQVKKCMGNPKNVFQAETFNGTICKDCFCVVEYEQKSLRIPKVSKKEKERLAAEKALEEGLETQAEKLQGETMKKNVKPKSKNNKETDPYEPSKNKVVQKGLFGDDKIVSKKKIKTTIINLGMKKS